MNLTSLKVWAFKHFFLLQIILNKGYRVICLAFCGSRPLWQTSLLPCYIIKWHPRHTKMGYCWPLNEIIPDLALLFLGPSLCVCVWGGGIIAALNVGGLRRCLPPLMCGAHTHICFHTHVTGDSTFFHLLGSSPMTKVFSVPSFRRLSAYGKLHI